MPSSRHKEVLCLLVAIAILSYPVLVWALSPTEQLKTTLGRVAEILKDPELQKEARKRERPKLIRQAILPRFDFGEMAKRSLGRHWRHHVDRERELVPPFADLVQDSYVSRIESYKLGSVVFTGERVETAFAEVHTKIAPGRGEELPIDYRLHLVGDEWKVYDILIEGVSLVNRYRSQFHRILTHGSLDDLLQRLRLGRVEDSESPQSDLYSSAALLLISIRSSPWRPK